MYTNFRQYKIYPIAILHATEYETAITRDIFHLLLSCLILYKEG
ncbi:hypothetical protein PORCRE_1612 [Porphyromonas crevioricanis JCM 15906]|uniref:Uncharacterized protein n=1 Tax=Porphyromonas crevioricanis JCM 15906 TaxID=1305617 RepID=T1CPX4_9PORP|nr:hypothetical protein PORCRE_1612 [Porphyromonas crevioricanis JCM 15906]GAD07949.1 hypothetical protein PORCAN_1578 [Porphyromonas crevioricanis JCM 13913]